MRKLRLGVAGLGFGAAVHVPAFRALGDVEIVAIAGSSLVRSQAAAERLGIAQPCDGVADLLRRDLDAVSLALPPHANAQALAQALARKLDVLVEKPVAADAEAAARLAALAGAQITAVDYIFAELATFQDLRRRIAANALGTIEAVTLDWQVESYAHKNRIWSWKMDAGRGGGVMTALGAHALFLVEWLLGPVTLTSAVFDATATQAFAPQDEIAAADTAEIVLQAGDAPVRLKLTNAKGGPLHRWTVTGSRATAILENDGADYVAGFRLLVDGAEVARESFGGGDSRLQAFAPLARRFADCVRERRPCHPDLAAGARVQQLMAQAAA